MLYSDLKDKEVINMKDCKRLGKVIDMELDECTGKVYKLIVSNYSIWSNWFKCEPDYVISYRDIKQIGPDIILVEMPC